MYEFLSALQEFLANDGNVISSAKFCTKACLMQKKKSSESALNRMGPTIEP